MRPTKETLLFKIPEATAKAAWAGLSFSPELRGAQAREDFALTVLDIYDSLKKYADEDENELAVLDTEFGSFVEAYASKYNAWLSAMGRCLSPMIAGPSKFPALRQEKANNSERKRLEEMTEFKDRAVKRLKKSMKPYGAGTTISADNPNAVQLMKLKIEEAESIQDCMKVVNKIVKSKKLTIEEKIAQMVDIGYERATAGELLSPDWAGRIGYPAYKLTNNNANIRRMKGRLVELEALDSREDLETEYGDITVIEDTSDNRIRIVFPDKPSADMRDELESNGFRWSPTNEAWQRQLTPNAVRAAKLIVQP